VTNHLGGRDGFVILPRDNAPMRFVHRGDLMITHGWFRNHVAQGVSANEASHRFPDDLATDCLDDEADGDIAEIRRMIELSGMIRAECMLLEAGAPDAPAT
jgi:hypothetical protein